MSKVFNKEEMIKIAGQIDQLLDKYGPDAGELVINVAPNNLPSLEVIWEDMGDPK